jgi:DNA-directed RNA polymerase specialized sigma24 family protein
VRDPDLAHDAAIEAISKYQDRTGRGLAATAKTIAKHMLLNLKKKHRRRLLEVDAPTFEDAPSIMHTLPARAERGEEPTEEVLEVRRALALLSPKDREAVEKGYLEPLEQGRELGLTQRVRYRVVRLLRAALRPETHALPTPAPSAAMQRPIKPDSVKRKLQRMAKHRKDPEAARAKAAAYRWARKFGPKHLSAPFVAAELVKAAKASGLSIADMAKKIGERLHAPGRENPAPLVVLSNPAPEREPSAAAVAAFKKFHGVAPRRVRRLPPGFPELVALGLLREVVYRPTIGQRKGPAFFHKFGAGGMLAATPDGTRLFLVPAPRRPFRVDWSRGIVG